MALSSVTIKAEGLDGRPYRIDINNDQSSNVKTARENFLVIEGGASQEARLDPIWPKTARIFVLGVDLLPLVEGAGEREKPVDIYDTGGSTTLEYTGYVVPDFYNDEPYSAEPLVEIRATDGIGTLENDSFGNIYSGSQEVALTSVLGKIMKSISGTNLNLDYGTHWYPTEITDATKNPLNQLKTEVHNYRGNRTLDTKGEWESQIFVLRDICKSQGLRLQQTRQDGELVWDFTQTGAIKESSSTGDKKIWRHDTSGSLVAGYPSTINVEKDLSSNEFESDHSREPERLRQAVDVVYDHVKIENLLGQGASGRGGQAGFEDVSKWTFNSNTGWASGQQAHSTNVTSDFTPSKTANDEYYALMTWDPVNANTGNRVLWANTSAGQVSPTAENVNGNLTISVGADGTNNPDINKIIPPSIEIKVGSYYLRNDTVKTRSSAVKGQTSIDIEPLAADIPKGTRVPLYRANNDPLIGKYRTFDGFITLSERATKSDEVIRGELSNDVDNGAKAVYSYFDTNQDWLDLIFYIWKGISDPDEYWTSLDIKFPWEGPSGQEISGDLTVSLGQYLQGTPVTDINILTGVDNISISLTKGGSA